MQRKQEPENLGSPRKLLKRQMIEEDQQLGAKIFCNCYTQSQIDGIHQVVEGLQNYHKIVSIAIRHQQKSLSTLPPTILLMFPQLKQRIGNCILRGRVNMNYLSQITKQWTPIINKFPQNIKLPKASINREQHQHIHTHDQHQNKISPNQILNVFHQMCKEWADIGCQTQKTIKKIISLINKHAIKHDSGTFGSFMIQGPGMGRLVYQILNNLCIETVETYEDDTLAFICSEYFLLRNPKPRKIYPFLLNFINNYKSSTPYTPIALPSQKIKPLCPEILSKLYSNYGYYPDKCRSNEFNGHLDVYISYFCTQKIKNILQWIQIVYKNLKEGGLWVNICFADFGSNIIKICYEEFREILSKSQFTFIEELVQSKKPLKLNPHQSLDGQQLQPMIEELSDVFYLVLRK